MHNVKKKKIATLGNEFHKILKMQTFLFLLNDILYNGSFNMKQEIDKLNKYIMQYWNQNMLPLSLPEFSNSNIFILQ